MKTNRSLLQKVVIKGNKRSILITLIDSEVGIAQIILALFEVLTESLLAIITNSRGLIKCKLIILFLVGNQKALTT